MVECGGLENRCTRKGTEGSNPSLSARKSKSPQAKAWGFCFSDKRRDLNLKGDFKGKDCFNSLNCQKI